MTMQSTLSFLSKAFW